MKTLSSAQTFLMKVLFPVTWIALFGLGTTCVWTGMCKSAGAPVEEKLIFLVAWIAGAFAISWFCAGLKRVRVDERNLYVSNFLDEITIPLSLISEVTENKWINFHPVTIHLRMTTKFGQRITFMPKLRFFSQRSHHPVVDELMEMARLK